VNYNSPAERALAGIDGLGEGYILLDGKLLGSKIRIDAGSG
jgi:hypothetical protein